MGNQERHRVDGDVMHTPATPQQILLGLVGLIGLLAIAVTDIGCGERVCVRSSDAGQRQLIQGRWSGFYYGPIQEE